MANRNFRRIVAMLFRGSMQPTGTVPTNPNRCNFVICCEYGDWSGFRTLAECQSQYKELEGKGRHDGYYWVEER